MKKIIRLEAHRRKILVLPILLLGIMIFCLSSVSALDLKTSLSTTKYPKLSVEDGLIFKTKVADMELVSNTEQCLINCESEIKVVLYQEAKLPYLFDLENKGTYEVYLKKYKNVTIPQESKSCTGGIGNETCDEKKTVYYNVTVQEEYWDLQTLDWTRKAGTYYVKLMGKKNPSESLDWSFNYYDIKSEDVKKEWAWWNSSWLYRKGITFTGGGVNNSVFINVSYEANMAFTNFSDLRFTMNASGTESEVGHWKYNNTCYDSASCIIVLPLQANTSGYMYYGNPTAPETSDCADAFTFCDDFTGASVDFVTNWQSTNLTAYTIDNYRLKIAKPSASSQGIKTRIFWTSDYAIEARVFTGSSAATADSYNMLTENAPDTFSGNNLNRQYQDDSIINANGGSPQITVAGAYGTALTPARWTARIVSSISNWTQFADNSSYYGGGTIINNYTGDPHDYDGYIGFLQFGGASDYFLTDWIYVTEYATYSATGTLGTEESGTPSYSLTVVPSYPAGDANLTSVPVGIGCNYTAAYQNITDVTIKVYNSSLTESYTDTESGLSVPSYNKTWSATGLNDGSYNWSCLGLGSLGINGTMATNRTFYLDVNPPNLTEALNQSTFTVPSMPQNWTLSYVASDIHLVTNNTGCWFYTSDNSTKLAYQCNSVNVSINFNTSGVKTISYFATDTFGWVAAKNATITFTEVTENLTYTNPVLESTSTTITLALNMTSNITQFNGTLVYNGTIKSSTYANETLTANITSTFTTPSVSNDTQFIFYFDYWLNGINYHSTNYNQTVNNVPTPVVSANCSAGLIPALTFYFNDELNESSLTADIEFNFQYGVITPYDVAFNGNLSNVNQFSVCINETVSPTYDLGIGELEYRLSGYGDRSYYLRNATISNDTQNITLYLLDSNYDEKFTIDTHYGNNLVTNGRVLVQKYFTNNASYKTVGIRITDDIGRFIEYLELDKKYRFLVLNSEETLLGTDYKVAICQSSPCTSSIYLSSSAEDPFSGYYDLYAGQVFYNITYNYSDEMMYLDYFDVTGLASSVRFLVTNDFVSKDPVVICDNVTAATSSILSCNTSGFQGDITAKAFIARSPEKYFGLYKLFKESITESLGQFGLIISIIIIITVFFAFSSDLSLGVMSIPLVLTMLKLINFVPLNWVVISVFWVLCLGIAALMRK